ncbi:carbohydrate porin [Pseudoduganella danionis]|uniref:Carbohydrate porin n=1 Tax=Pseudoduganella danionis TaxID=1890295 RepID=A0ABW9SIZ4_9BURK|nr:carbohydrate porin [Pseudoduganella danionis]MTW32111.1 carbohydrate porin [Pseudoduganella danionis]
MRRIFSRSKFFTGCAVLPLLTGYAHADQAATPEDWNAHLQSTYTWQNKHAFAAAYSGPNSLSTNRELSYSWTTTLALGWRPWQGGELYVNPEAAQGIPLSGLTGLGGFSNGDMGRASGSNLKLYRARLFLRQSWQQDGETEALESAANQLAGTQSRRRWVLTAGNLSVLDVFDPNSYAHDPRTQFLNWSLMTYGAYDYAADARGYTWGAALERYADDWVLRAGRFIEPRQPNQQALDPKIWQHYGDQIELEHAHTLAGQPGRVRALAFNSHLRMARFEDATQLASRTGSTPELGLVRRGDQHKRGLGISVEQAVGADLGLFGRYSKADGQTETYAFTEIDLSLTAGAVLRGTAWQRARDSIGVAVASNGLSGARRAYLAAGGISFFIGDGALQYRQEQAMEAYYNLALNPSLALTLDWQRIRHPAYNAARGPVDIASLRLHTEF